MARLLFIPVVAGAFWYTRSGVKLTDKDLILIRDFENTTGESVFDASLREALFIGLAQSSMPNLISAEKAAETLHAESLSANTPVTRELAPKLCAHLGATVFLTGTIGRNDNAYALKLGVFPCAVSKEIASVKTEANGKGEVRPCRVSEADRKPWDCRELLVRGARSSRGQARAQSLSGSTSLARNSYRRFCELRKTADTDLPILKAARAEFAKLK